MLHDFRLNMDVLTAMAVGETSVWVAGEPRLLLRSGPSTRNDDLKIYQDSSRLP